MDGNPTSNDSSPRGLDEVGHDIPTVSARQDSHVGGWNESSEVSSPKPFEDDSNEMWDEVLRNLGVDPATGGPLHPSDPLPPKSAEQLARESKAFNEWRKQFQPSKDGDRRDQPSPEIVAEHRPGSGAVTRDPDHPRSNLGVDPAAADPSSP